jgi:hypothetical protein
MWKIDENCGNVTVNPVNHTSTWKHHETCPCFHVASCVDRCWPPVLHVFHISLHSIFDFLTRILNTSPRSMRTDEERWGKMRVMENYGKLWKVMESLRRVKHDWATKQRDNVRTTWGPGFRGRPPWRWPWPLGALGADLFRMEFPFVVPAFSVDGSHCSHFRSRFSASESVLTFWHVLTFWQLVKSCPHRMSWRRKAATFCVNDLNTLLSDLLIEMSWNVDVDMTSTWRGRPEQLGSGNARSVPGGMRSHYTPQDKKKH